MPEWWYSQDVPDLAISRTRFLIYLRASGWSCSLNNWTQLSAPLVFSNGIVRVDGIRATNSLHFYRGAEAP